MKRNKNIKVKYKVSSNKTKLLLYLMVFVMVINVTILYFLANENKAQLKYVVIISFIFFMLSFISLILNLGNIIDEFFPINEKDKYNKNNIKLNNFIYKSTINLFFISLGLVIFEIEYLNKTIGTIEFFLFQQ